MKKFFKIFGISCAIILGVLLISIGVYALAGGFNEKVIGMTSIYFGDTDGEREKRLVIEDDIRLVINYEPLDATQKTLKTFVTESQNCVQVPETIVAGEPFDIYVKKDANGRNIGGNVQIEFVSSNKDSESNLITPCKLQLTVDVPVEDSDLNFSSSLNYGSSVDRPNQYIIPKSDYKTTFYLKSNKDNIFDINKWSVSENKEIYFSYAIDESSDYTSIDVLDEVVDNNNPVDCVYNRLEHRYELNFYPGKIDVNIINIQAKVHRSYAIQQEFKALGFEDFEKIYLKNNVTDNQLANDSTFEALLAKFSDFLDKYYLEYFASNNQEAMTFFTRLSTSGKVNIPLVGEIKANLKEALKYVFVNNVIEFYVSDVKVNVFNVKKSVVNMNLIDLVDVFDSQTQTYVEVRDRKEVLYVTSDAKDPNKVGLFSYFEIILDANDLNNPGASIDEVAKKDLMNNVTVDVLVYDGSGKSKMTNNSPVSFPVNSNVTSNWDTFSKDIPTGDINNIAKFGYNEQYLTVETSNNNNLDQKTWTINKLVPSKTNDFHIYLMFTLKVNDEDGEQTFYDFAEIKLLENSDTKRSGEDKSKSLQMSDSMYVYVDEEINYTLMNEGLTGKTQDISVSKATSGSYKATFDSFKLFAYLGTEAVDDKGNTVVSFEGDTKSIMTASQFSEGVTYSVISNTLTLPNGVKSSRLCRFVNLDTNKLIYNVDQKKPEFVTDATNNIIYAYEIDWEDLNAISASNNKVQLFALYVLTDEDNNAINREGQRLFNDAGAMIDKDGLEYEYDKANNVVVYGEFVQVNGVVTPVVEYISLQDVFFEDSNTIKVNSVFENVYYYTKLASAVNLLELNVAGDAYDLVPYNEGDYVYRNGNSRVLGRELKLIAGNTYDNILTVLPYDINSRKEVSNTDTLVGKDDSERQALIAKHSKISNQLLAYFEAITNGGLDFEFNEEYGSVEVDDENAVAGIDNIHPIYITVNARKAYSLVDRPFIKLSDNYINNALYVDQNAIVLVEINEVRITDFSYQYNEKGVLGYEQIENPDGSIELKRKVFEVNGKVDTGSGWEWGENDQLFNANFAHPVIFDTNHNHTALAEQNVIVSNDSNIKTNLFDGVVINGEAVEFNFIKTPTDLDGNGVIEADEFIYSTDSLHYSNSIIDISELSSQNIEYHIFDYLFDTSGYDSATFESIKDYINAMLSSKTSHIYNTINVEYSNTTTANLGDMYVNVYNIKIINGTEEEAVAPQDYYKYFTNTNQSTSIYYMTKDNKTIPYIKVKIVDIDESDDKTFYALSLNTNTSKFSFDFDTVWTFGGETEGENEVIKSYSVIATFEVPTFEFNNEGGSSLEIDPSNQNIATITNTFNAGAVVNLADYIYAYYDSSNKKELHQKVSYTITNSNYGYFEHTTGIKLPTITGVEAAELHLYDSINGGTLNITVKMLGCQDLTLIVKFNSNLTKKNDLSTAKFITYTSYSKLYDGSNIEYHVADGKISYKIAEGQSYKEVSIDVTPFEIKQDYNEIAGVMKDAISYNLTDLIGIYKDGENMLQGFKFSEIGVRYKDLMGDYIDGSWKLDNNDKYVCTLIKDQVYIIIDKNLLIIVGDIYTDVEVFFANNIFDEDAGGLNISADDSIRSSNYKLTICPVLKLNKSNSITKPGESNYYVYDSTSMFVNGSNLYDSTFTLNILQTYASNAEYSSYKLDLTDSITITKINVTNIGQSWQYKNDDIKAQFVAREKNGQGVWVYKENTFTNIGNIVYGSTEDLKIDGGVLNTIPLPQSIILPVNVGFEGGFIGLNDNAGINLMIPIGGYNIMYKTGDNKLDYVKASYDYTNKKFISNDRLSNITIALTAGKVHYMTEYIYITYAGNDLGFFNDNVAIAKNVNLDYLRDNIGTPEDEGRMELKDATTNLTYGTLEGFILNLNTYINTASASVGITAIGYTIVDASTIYSFGVEIPINIEIKPNISQVLIVDGLGINNDITATDGVTAVVGGNLSELTQYILTPNLETNIEFRIETIDGEENAFRYVLYEGGIKTNKYILFTFDEFVVNVDDKTFKFPTGESDEITLNYMITIQGTNSVTYRNDLVLKITSAS